MLATGHYVASRALPDGGRALLRARDPERDQSYFLYGTTPEQLAMLRFPLGDLTKTETRELAREFGLHIADKHDSQDICFVPTGSYSDIVGRLKPEAASRARSCTSTAACSAATRASCITRSASGAASASSLGEPLFVVGLDPAAHRVIVGPREALATSTLALRDVNWLGEDDLGALPAEGLDVFVKVRSTREPRPALLRK